VTTRETSQPADIPKDFLKRSNENVDKKPGTEICRVKRRLFVKQRRKEKNTDVLD
jgi:hypothetical protein